MAQATGQRPAVKPFNPSHALEPNPFEQSFCSKPSTSSSPVDSILSSAGGPSTGATSISSQRTKDLNQNEDTSPSSQRESPLAGIDGGNVKAGSPSLSGENKGDSNSVGMSRSRNGSEMGKNDSTNANGIDSNSPNSKNGNVNGSSGSSSGGGGGIHSITTPKPLLPGVASMASPGSLGGYGWNSSLASSLRTGPLSPAMLAGPHSSGSGGHQHQHSSSGSGFDISSFRTGFTPDLNNYKTGLTPLGSSASNIPPPSPSTAALIALMNSSSNGSSSPLGGVNSSTMTPNTLAALANHHHTNLSPSNHHHHGGNNSGYFGREHSGAFDLAFGRSLSEKKVSRLRTSSGREVGIEDDDDQEAREEESRKNQKEADSLINTDGGIEDHQVKVKTEENGSSLDDGNASRSNEQSRRSSQVKGQPNSRPDTTSNRNQNESSDGLHLLHRAAHDVGNHPQPPSSNHYQQQQQQHHSQQQHQHHQQQQLRHHQQQYEHPPNPHPLPPQSGQVVSSSSTRSPLTNGATINSNPSQLYSSSNKRRNPDAESTKEDPSSNYQTTGGAASSSKGKGKKARTSNASRGKSTETPQQFGSPDLAGQSNRGSAAPSETASIDLDELDDKPESKAGKGKKKAKDVDDEPQSEEAKRKEFLERNRQAALKCRQRKKAWVQDLQSRNAELEVQNETLQHTLASMKQEMDSLRMQLMSRDRDNNNGGGGNGNSSNHRGGRPTEERGVNSSSDLASGMVGNMATGIPPQSYRQSSISLPNPHHNPGLPQQQQHQHQHQHHPHHQQHSSSNHHHQGMARSPPNHLAQLPRR